MQPGTNQVIVIIDDNFGTVIIGVLVSSFASVGTLSTTNAAKRNVGKGLGLIQVSEVRCASLGSTVVGCDVEGISIKIGQAW